MRFQTSIGLVAIGLALCAGCETRPPGASDTSATEPAPLEPAPQAAAPAAPPEMVREEATVGVGKRGGDLPVEPRPVDIITTPTNVYFAAKEQIAFNIQVPQALDLYKASEGRGPQSEQEFFDKVIKANNIQLPELPEGHKYVFDVEQQQLMVEHPQ